MRNFFGLLKKNKTSLSEPLLQLQKELNQKKKLLTSIKRPTQKDEIIIQNILNQTEGSNLNNLTRTKAYLDFYNRHPSIHWSFLAHMVSRNAGWNMTDLKGTWLSKLLTDKECKSFFLFLERGNWLIFQDAYPQLLLYEESFKHGRNLFYLLPHFHVSTFMETIWNHFWSKKNSQILTSALIVNEQHYLEQNLLVNPTVQFEVLDNIEFALQDLLSMNQILFPFRENNKTRLIGKTVHHFESVQSRISIGRDLYSLLFSNPERLKNIEQWANSNAHTASRKDYWPHLFNVINEEIPGKLHKFRLNTCNLIPGSPRIYSPSLSFAWRDVQHRKPENIDWFQNSDTLHYLKPTAKPSKEDIIKEYCNTLERLELITSYLNVD